MQFIALKIDLNKVRSCETDFFCKIMKKKISNQRPVICIFFYLELDCPMDNFATAKETA